MGLIILGISLAVLAVLAASKAAARSSEPKALTTETTAIPEETSSLRAIAQNAFSYIKNGGRNKSKIKSYQKSIGCSQTGKPDNQTRARIERILGYKVAWPSVTTTKKATAKKATAKKTAATKTTTTVAPKEEIPPLTEQRGEEKGPLATALDLLIPKSPQTTTTRKVDKAPAKKIPTKPAPKASTDKNDQIKASNELDRYLNTPPTENNISRAIIKDYQSRMGGLVADGVPGPKTLSRAIAILGRTPSWPLINAANGLKTYYSKGGRDKTTIKNFQRLMCELTPDGVVGPKTKARYKQLTGKGF